MRPLFAVALLLLFAGCGGGGGSAPPPATGDARAAIASSLGLAPDVCALATGEEVARTTVATSAAGRIDKVDIRSCGDLVHLYEAVPAGATAQTPVVIALHQTADEGKDEVMGLRGNPALAYGRTFFDNGFIVVAPDVFIAGENFDPATNWDTAPLYRAFPQWSAMGRMLLDHLAVARYVDRRHATACSAAVGHSLGGHNALFLAAFDAGVDAVVSSGGFESIALDDDAMRWARESYFIYMPSLRPHVRGPAPRTVPWDFDDVLELVAPRPTLIVQGTRDPLWTHPESVPAMVAKARQDVPAARIETLLHDGGHEFGSELQLKALAFVQKACGA